MKASTKVKAVRAAKWVAIHLAAAAVGAAIGTVINKALSSN